MVEMEPLKVQLRAIVDHWNRLETELGQALTLEGGYTRDQMAADLKALESSETEVTTRVSAQEREAEARNLLKTTLLLRFDQAKNKIKAQFKSTPHAAAVPLKPEATYGQTKTLRAFDDLAEVWRILDADTTLPESQRPMTIARGYNQADFAADITALRASYNAVGSANRETKQRRAVRSTPLPGLAKRVTQYRALAKSELEPGDALYATIP